MRAEARIEQSPVAARLAQVGEPLAAPLTRGVARELLSGRSLRLGHAMHPMLTDLPIGLWTSSFILDVAGGRDARRTSQRFVGLGLLTALPAALSGASDWASDPEPEVQRVGAVHAVGNLLATFAYLRSWLARHRDHHAAGVAWGLAGATFATAAGHLGGHLVLRLGAGNGPRDAEPPRLSQFTAHSDCG